MNGGIFACVVSCTNVAVAGALFSTDIANCRSACGVSNKSAQGALRLVGACDLAKASLYTKTRSEVMLRALVNCQKPEPWKKQSTWF